MGSSVGFIFGGVLEITDGVVGFVRTLLTAVFSLIGNTIGYGYV